MDEVGPLGEEVAAGLTRRCDGRGRRYVARPRSRAATNASVVRLKTNARLRADPRTAVTDVCRIDDGGVRQRRLGAIAAPNWTRRTMPWARRWRESSS